MNGRCCEIRGQVRVNEHRAGTALNLRERHAFVAALHRQTLLAVLVRRSLPRAMGNRVRDPDLLREQQRRGEGETQQQLAEGLRTHESGSRDATEGHDRVESSAKTSAEKP